MIYGNEWQQWFHNVPTFNRVIDERNFHCTHQLYRCWLRSYLNIVISGHDVIILTSNSRDNRPPYCPVPLSTTMYIVLVYLYLPCNYTYWPNPITCFDRLILVTLCNILCNIERILTVSITIVYFVIYSHVKLT